MQFDKDLNSDKAELFLKVRDLIMKSIGSDAKEKLSENITSLYSNEGGFCYIKTADDHIRIGWFRGAHIDDKPKQLFGKGKTIRGHKIYQLDKTQKEAVKYYIQQTKMFLIEHNEIMKMRKR